MGITVLASINLEDEAAADVVMAAAKAQAGENGTVVAAVVVPDYGFGIVRSHFPDGFQDTITKAVTESLEAFCGRHGGDAVRPWVGHGSVNREIVRAAGELGADMIVVGAGDSDVTDQVLGSQASRIASHAPCSVLVIRS